MALTVCIRKEKCVGCFCRQIRQRPAGLNHFNRGNAPGLAQPCRQQTTARELLFPAMCEAVEGHWGGGWGGKLSPGSGTHGQGSP